MCIGDFPRLFILAGFSPIQPKRGLDILNLLLFACLASTLKNLNVYFYWITNNGQIFLKSEMIYIYCDKKQLDICGNFIYYDIKMPIFCKSFVKTSSFWMLCLVVFFWLSTRSKPESITFNDRQSTDNVTISPALTLTTERLSNLWLSTRDKIQRKSTLPSNYGYGLQFKNLCLLLCILLAGDIATNPGPTNCGNGTLNMFYQNVRSLKSTYWDNSCNLKESKLSCFHDIVTTNQFDVIALTETWLDSSISNHELPRGYVVHRRDRQDKLGGGVLLAINDTIKTDPFNFTSKSLELVGAIINSVSKKVLVCACYRPPNVGVEFQQEFNRFLKCASNSNYKDIIILGDFNLPSIKWLNGSGFSDLTVESSFTDVLQDSGLFQLIDSPTRGKNVLDLILTTNEYLINNITVTDEESVSLKSDHKPITADINIIRKF